MHLNSPMQSMMKGLRIAYNGCLQAYTEPRISALQQRSLRALLITLVLSYLALLWLMLPFQLLLFLLSQVLPDRSELLTDQAQTLTRWFHIITDSETYSELRQRLTLSACLQQMVWFIPFAVLVVIRYVLGGYEGHFFTMLELRNKPLHDTIIALQPMHAGEILGRQLLRLTKLAAKGFLFYVFWIFPLLSCIFIPSWYLLTLPHMRNRFRVLALLGCSAFFLWFFHYRAVMGHFWLMIAYVFTRLNKYYHAPGTREQLGAILFCAVAAVPAFQHLSLAFINLSITTIAFAMELLDPYLVRARLDDSQMHELLARNRLLLLGYGLPLLCSVSVPLLGLSAWGYIQASAACLLGDMSGVEINYRRARLRSSSSSSTN